jgi:predicted TIM-barrel fold metal-dependent hydrolase
MPHVDVHSHLYPPEYIELLKKRSEVPYVKLFPHIGLPCLCNRPYYPASGGLPGRPLTDHYYSVKAKIAFMDTHGIEISVLSMGNPWLDFLEPSTAGEIAASMNHAMNSLCQEYQQRLFFFAVLPMSAPDDSAIITEIQHITTLPQARGVVMGTNGLGEGLDDPRLLPIWRELAAANLPVFIHPNYGLPASVWGENHASSQILPLSIGFTTETAIAITRMFLAGVFDTVPNLQLILSHSGGTLPFLAGRIEACIAHDMKRALSDEPRVPLWEVLRKNLYLDGVIFDKIGLRTAIEASGIDRVMFGTDHPFFAPVKEMPLWPAMTLNRDAARELLDDKEYEMVMGGNAQRVLQL